MMKILMALMLTMVLAGPVAALEVAGVHLEPTVTVNNHPLQLNGYGIRKKFWIKVYIGSLYTAKAMSTAESVMADPGDKLIRMNFLHSRVDRDKITEAFNEGFKNTGMAGTDVTRQFIALFTNDFARGDTVDLVLGGDGTVVYKYNGRIIGEINSKPLVKGVLGIYLGATPADEDLKKGMLGKR